MKEILGQFAAYNKWANKKLISRLLTIAPDLLDRPVASSFPSLRKTVYHIWSAERMWLQRLALVERPIWAEEEFEGDFTEACQRWSQSSDELAAFVEGQRDEKAFHHVFHYFNLKQAPMKNSVAEALLHVFNHGTFHRGQIITMMRTLGLDKIPATDFIVFARKK